MRIVNALRESIKLRKGGRNMETIHKGTLAQTPPHHQFIDILCHHIFGQVNSGSNFHLELQVHYLWT